MSTSISFHVAGIPAPQGSKRHVGNGRMIESSKALPAWRAAVKAAAEAAHHGEPIDQPVSVKVVFVMPRPKRPRFPVPATAPDADKLMRAVGDGLEQSGLLRNDSRIVHWDARKVYEEPRIPTGAHIQVEVLS